MKKKIIFGLILVIVISLQSLIVVKTASAQNSTATTPSSSGVPAPFVPIFYLKYVNLSYTISTNSTNQYTGANVVTTNTYINNTIEVVIENQPFAVPQTQNTKIPVLALSLYYIVQEKGHFSDQWNVGSPVLASNTQDTVIDYGFSGENGSVVETQIAPVPNGGQVDFQVQAVIGWYEPVWNNNGMPGFSAEFDNVASSSWSNTLTITIPSGATSASISSSSPYPTLSPTITSTSTSNSTLTSPNPTATPQNPKTGVQTKKGAGFNWTQIALFAAIAVIVALVVTVTALLHRHRKTANLKQ